MMNDRKENKFIKSPTFKGGMKALRAFVSANMKYPKTALEDRIGRLLSSGRERSVPGIFPVRHAQPGGVSPSLTIREWESRHLCTIPCSEVEGGIAAGFYLPHGSQRRRPSNKTVFR